MLESVMKKYLTVLVLAVFLLTGCGKTDNNQSSTETPSETNGGKINSLKDLMGLGTAQKCTWTIVDENSEMRGEILIKGKVFRQNTFIKNEREEIATVSISDGEWFYSWNEKMKDQGIKMKIEQNSDDANNETSGNYGNVNWDDKYNYACQPATITDADLAIPTDITFVDLQSQMEELQKNYGDLIPSIPAEQ